jgi:hypothetical protein
LLVRFASGGSLPEPGGPLSEQLTIFADGHANLVLVYPHRRHVQRFALVPAALAAVKARIAAARFNGLAPRYGASSVVSEDCGTTMVTTGGHSVLLENCASGPARLQRLVNELESLASTQGG